MTLSVNSAQAAIPSKVDGSQLKGFKLQLDGGLFSKDFSGEVKGVHLQQVSLSDKGQRYVQNRMVGTASFPNTSAQDIGNITSGLEAAGYRLVSDSLKVDSKGMSISVVIPENAEGASEAFASAEQAYNPGGSIQ